MKLVSPESLFEEQRRVLDEYVQYLPEGAICINVVIGDAPWDVRPLFFAEGEVRIARFSERISNEALTRAAAEIEGFSLLFNKETSISTIPDISRLLLVRPYAASTLLDELQQGLLKDRTSLRSIVERLIQVVVSLSQRSVVHGHLSPANIILKESGELTLVDPIIGALSGTRDSFSAPELHKGELPNASADIYSLGRLARTLLGDELSDRQSSVVEQALLSSPKQRPSLLEMTLAFESNGSSRSTNVGSQQEVPAMQGVSSEASLEPTGVEEKRAPSTFGLLPVVILVLIVVGISGLFYLKARNPARYHLLAQYIPYLTAEYSAEYERDWASNQKSRMSVVARAAVVRGEPSAIHTIVEDISNGSNPPFVRSKFLRIALNTDWSGELDWEEYRVALGLGLQGLLPNTALKLPPLKKLHPGVLLAIVAETDPRLVSDELKALPLEQFKSLPEPFLNLFAALGSIGAVSLGDPRVIGMAALSTGHISKESVKAVLPSSMPTQEVVLLLRVLDPLVTTHPALLSLLWEELSERDDNLAQAIAWFGTFDIPGWDEVSMPLKLKTLTGSVADSFSFTQLTDLLTFPISEVRLGAMKVLQRRERALNATVLQTVISAADSITREQVVALLATLRVSEEKRTPFVTAWFEMRPSANFVVLLLLARSQVAKDDIFNLEAARYLRKTEWEGTTDILSLMARHPEPLARIMAYTRLSSTDKQQREILEERLTNEENAACKKVLQEKISK